MCKISTQTLIFNLPIKIYNKPKGKKYIREIYFHVRRMNGLFKIGRIEDYVLNPSYKKVNVDIDDFKKKITIMPSAHTDVFYDYDRDALWCIDYATISICVLNLPE